jgi:hypothetical protein
MLKLTFYVPVESCEVVKNALFDAGAGKIGNYDRCSFETAGTGQFRALEGANPTIGKLGIVKKISEVRVEMVMNDHILIDVIKALKSSHPYETPAYDVVKCMEV